MAVRGHRNQSKGKYVMKKSPLFHRIRCLTLATLAVGAASLAAPVFAAFPDKPISLVVGFTPGGGVDVVGRIIAQGMGENLKTSVVVENKPGFSGNISAQYVKRAAPDGYTLLMAPTTSYAMTEKILGKETVGYDLLADFIPVSTLGELPLILLANKQLGMNNYADMSAKARANPGKYAYGSTGNGSTEHIVTELFRQQAKVDLLHVPYRGSSPAMSDLLGGEIQMMFTTSPTALANLPSGRVTALGVASQKRLTVLPDVPTFAEQGLPAFNAVAVYSILAPKGTPEDVIVKLNAAISEVLKTPAIKDKLSQLGVEVVQTTPQQSRQRLEAEVAKWNTAIDQTKITVQ